MTCEEKALKFTPNLVCSHLLVVLALTILCLGASARSDSAYRTTCPTITKVSKGPMTIGLKDRYLGLCYFITKSKDCPASWAKFEEIVLSRDPDDFSWRDYEPLFDIIHTKPGPGKSTFWAGSGFVVHRLAAMNANYVTLENTFPAIAMDGTSFCPTAAPVPPTETAPTTSIAVPPSNDSSPSSQLLHREAVSQSSSIRSMASEGRTWELDKPCTGYTPSNITVSPIPLLPNASYYDFRDAYGAWWQAASIRFAQEAVGTVNVVYESAPEGPTFCPGEYFGSIEMPALNTTTVTSMRVLVATHPDNPVERCGSGSFLLLRKMAEVHFANSSNFKFSCVDDPFDLTMVRCVRSSQNDPYCKKLISRFYPCPSLPPIDNPTTLPNIPSAAHPTAPMPITAPAVGPTSSPSNIPVVFHPTSSQCSVNCLSKTTFRFLLVGVSLATFFVGILTAVVAQTLIRHCKKSKSKNGQFTPSSSMKEIGYTSLLEDGLQGDQ